MIRDAKGLESHVVWPRLSRFPRIIRSEYADQPKGVSSGPSRFSSPNGAFQVLYAAQNLQTALAETIIRDRFVGRARRYVGYSTLEGRAVTLICALGLDTDIGRARAHGPGQAFSEWLHLKYRPRWPPV